MSTLCVIIFLEILEINIVLSPLIQFVPSLRAATAPLCLTLALTTGSVEIGPCSVSWPYNTLTQV